MAAARDTLHDLVDRIPEAEFRSTAVLEFLSQESVDPAMAASIRRGIAEAGAGKTIVCRNFDEMVDRLLAKE